MKVETFNYIKQGMDNNVSKGTPIQIGLKNGQTFCGIFESSPSHIGVFNIMVPRNGTEAARLYWFELEEIASIGFPHI
ncbi:MAG: hypothetical protein F8N15_01225 [Methanobacterium sp.]|nr:hypothetical protein [Methanobacterium sp.]